MFTISDFRDDTCVLCEKQKPIFVVTCGRGTFVAANFCSRCLEKQAALQSKTRTANANGETQIVTANMTKVNG